MRLIPRLLLLALFALALFSRPSQMTSAIGADCLYQCEGSTCYDYGNHADFCNEIRAKCSARCGNGRRWWGAIAYSVKDHGFGYSIEFNKEEDAKRDAMKRCNGAKCEIWATFENECGAVAADGGEVVHVAGRSHRDVGIHGYLRGRWSGARR